MVKVRRAILAASTFLFATVFTPVLHAEEPDTTSATDDAATKAAREACGSPVDTFKQNIAEEARKAGVSEHAIDELKKATFDQKVLDRDNGQAIFNLTFAEFAKRVIPEARLKKGKDALQKYSDIFAKAEQKYGVPGPVIAAFWGLETDYGAVQGNFDTLNALFTLSHDCRRPELFRPQLIALLKLFDRGVVNAETTGAWAGEIGQMQLLPKDYLERGVDGDGDGKIDLKGSVLSLIHI